MSLRERLLLTVACPECGKEHNFSVGGVVAKGTIYCSCGKTIIIDNANRYGKRINELERPSPQVALSTKAEKKVEIEEEKPKTTKPKAEKPKTAKPKTKKPKATKPKTAKPKAKKKTTTKKPKKEDAKK
jgi:outer membrane biosynthesis protein TonB